MRILHRQLLISSIRSNSLIYVLKRSLIEILTHLFGQDEFDKRYLSIQSLQKMNVQSLHILGLNTKLLHILQI